MHKRPSHSERILPATIELDGGPSLRSISRLCALNERGTYILIKAMESHIKGLSLPG